MVFVTLIGFLLTGGSSIYFCWLEDYIRRKDFKVVLYRQSLVYQGIATSCNGCKSLLIDYCIRRIYDPYFRYKECIV